MAGKFISDEEMTKLDQANAPKVISDEDMAKMESAQQKPAVQRESYGRGLLRGALESLPIVGSAAGGIAGAPAGPLGSLGGAGVGAYAGKSLENIGKRYLLDEGPKTTQEILTEPIVEGAKGLLAEGGGQLVGKAIQSAPAQKVAQYVGEKIGKIGSKIGSALTGVSEKEITTYAKKADEINKMAKSSAGSTAEAADQMRAKFTQDIASKRQQLGGQIGRSLEGNVSQVESKPIVEAIESQKRQINAKLNPDQIKEVDDIITKVKSLADKDGNIPVKDAHDLKEYLQDLASSSYQKGGQIFTIGKQSARSAKSGAAVVRESINKLVPEVADANNKLFQLRNIEKNINKNIIAAGKPEAALMAAGTGGNAANVKNLQKLGEITGTDMLGEAEKLAAMKTFGSPGLLPADTTGKAVGRMGLGGGAGFLAGGVPGAVVGSALTSPAALKASIDAGRISRGLLRGTGLLNEQIAPRLAIGAGRGLLKDK